MESIKIIQFEAENVKRIRAVKIEPTINGLTVIGGRNEQGKSSVLDAIAWALGGNSFRPSEAVREGSSIPPTMQIKLSNGLIVERKGKNSDLTVTDPTGKKSGQQLLNDFVEELAINLPKFMQASGKEKAQTLLRIIGVEKELSELERTETEIYNNRRVIGQIADQKRKYAKEQKYFPHVPKEPVSASDLIKAQQDILSKNGENQRKRQNVETLRTQEASISAKIADLQRQMDALNAKHNEILGDLETAKKSAQDLKDENTLELEENIQEIEAINRKIRVNLDRDKAEDDALNYENQYNALTAKLDAVREKKVGLLQNAQLPLPELSVSDGELTYQGKKWDCMSGSAQLRVATAIAHKLNPKCGFVLLDRLEAMDIDTLQEFGGWLEAEGLQAIATRVSTGSECQIIIEDGYAVGQPEPKEPDPTTTGTWKKGVF